MATYAIGDVQGCLEPLRRLLDKIAFDTARDRLWFTGDLVNRGPDSLGVLRLVKSLDACSLTVLGNHDLHLLARAFDPHRRGKKGDTLTAVLAAKDAAPLLEWLRQRPLMHRDTALGCTLLHAGLPPQWTVDEAATHACEVEAQLHGGDFTNFLSTMYGDAPAHWSANLTGPARLRYITNCFTRMRFCRPDGSLELTVKVGLDIPTPGLLPWFMLPDRASVTEPIIFGHWSTLELSTDQARQYNVYPLDTGAVWGGMLTALRLEDRVRFGVEGIRGAARER